MLVARLSLSLGVRRREHEARYAFSSDYSACAAQEQKGGSCADARGSPSVACSDRGDLEKDSHHCVRTSGRRVVVRELSGRGSRVGMGSFRYVFPYYRCLRRMRPEGLSRPRTGEVDRRWIGEDSGCDQQCTVIERRTMRCSSIAGRCRSSQHEFSPDLELQAYCQSLYR